MQFLDCSSLKCRRSSPKHHVGRHDYHFKLNSGAVNFRATTNKCCFSRVLQAALIGDDVLKHVQFKLDPTTKTTTATTTTNTTTTTTTMMSMMMIINLGQYKAGW